MNSLNRLAVVLFLTPFGCFAAAPVEGQWVLNLGRRTLLILSITSSRDAGRPVSGWLSRPRNFKTSDGSTFSHIRGPVNTGPIVASSWNGDVLSITVRDPENQSDEDTFLFTLKDRDHAEVQLKGIPMPPFQLVRARGTPSIATDWNESQTYSPDDDAPSSPEMKRIFDADQQVRQDVSKIDWTSIAKSDAERREATRKLLAESGLHAGEDFTRAAFVFQHGSTPNDYLLAHTLAMIAVKKGDGSALWIAAATLDRYLQSIHQAQIYGTQFLTPSDGPVTQEPYNRELISDALRRQLGVPVQSAQEEQRKEWDAKRMPSK